MRTRNISKKLVSLALTIAIIGTGSGINTLANSVNDGKNSQKAVDNKLITLRPTAGYSLEPVVSLQWAKKTYERKNNNGKTKTAR